MKTGLIAFSARGEALGERLLAFYRERGDEANLTRCPSGGLAAWTEEHFRSEDALVFIGSCGIAVRAIAGHVVSKTCDPAVIVCDELGTFCVSLLSGHIGGANELCADTARAAGAVPVITTATDRNGVFAVDTWARQQGLRIANPERIKWVSARLLAGDTVKLQSSLPFTGELPKGLVSVEEGGDILITHRTRGRAEALRLVPPCITLGVGCRRDTPAELFEEAFELMLKKASCHPEAIKQICSIDLKANEPGLIEFCRRHKLPYITYTAEALRAVPGNYTASAFVKSVTGVDNVCERSAMLGAGTGAKLLSGKDAGKGITMAMAIEPYTIHFESSEEKK